MGGYFNGHLSVCNCYYWMVRWMKEFTRLLLQLSTDEVIYGVIILRWSRDQKLQINDLLPYTLCLYPSFYLGRKICLCVTINLRNWIGIAIEQAHMYTHWHLLKHISQVPEQFGCICPFLDGYSVMGCLTTHCFLPKANHFASLSLIHSQLQLDPERNIIQSLFYCKYILIFKKWIY